MKTCDYNCSKFCVSCQHYNTRERHCELHQETKDLLDVCEDFHCRRAEDE